MSEYDLLYILRCYMRDIRNREAWKTYNRYLAPWRSLN